VKRKNSDQVLENFAWECLQLKDGDYWDTLSLCPIPQVRGLSDGIEIGHSFYYVYLGCYACLNCLRIIQFQRTGTFVHLQVEEGNVNGGSHAI